VAQGVGHEFKLQYCKKKKKRQKFLWALIFQQFLSLLTSPQYSAESHTMWKRHSTLHAGRKNAITLLLGVSPKWICPHMVAAVPLSVLLMNVA
jgi:hypothetical protein